MFSMANKTDYAENTTYAMPTSERHEIVSATITLLETPIQDSVSIRGMTEVDSAPTETGTFQVDYENKQVKFYTDESGVIEVIYDYEKTVYEAIITNKESAIGEATAIWPVYGSGDDCTESSIIGYYVVKVFRARVTTVPGVDTSYKTAATFNFTLSALDAKRNDEGCYSTAYFRK